MVLHLSSWKRYRETILISFGFLFHAVRFHTSVHLAIATYAICFTGKISRVHTSAVK